MRLKVKTMLHFVVIGAVFWTAHAKGADLASPDLVEAAKKEGSLVWYTTLPVAESQEWISQFTQMYGIKVNVFRSAPTSLTQRLQTEVPAGRWGFDVILNRATNIELYRYKGWVQKLNYPERKRFIEGFVDAEDYWITLYMHPLVIAFNTTQVRPNEVPKSYQDLLNPKWKGKLSFDEQEVDLYVTLLKIMGRERGREWFKKLVANDLRTLRGKTLGTQLLAAGEFAIFTSAYAPQVELYRAKGAPIDWTAVEPVPVNMIALGMAAKPAHPNAARLFLYWSVSPEALKHLNAMADRIPARMGVPISNKRIEKLVRMKLEPVDISIAEKYAEYTKELASVLGARK